MRHAITRMTPTVAGSTRFWFVATGTTLVGLFALAVAANALYYDDANGIRYNTSLTWVIVLAGLPPSWSAVRDAIGFCERTMLGCLAATVVVCSLTARQATSVSRCVVCAAQCTSWTVPVSA